MRSERGMIMKCKEEFDLASAFGVDELGADDIWFQFTAGGFLAECNGRRFVAYGDYHGPDDYSVVHGPNQLDVDVICAIIDGGQQPKTYAKGE